MKFNGIKHGVTGNIKNRFKIPVGNTVLSMPLLFSNDTLPKNRTVVQFVPTSLCEAFLYCVGYDVFNHVLKLSKLMPEMFLPPCRSRST